MKTPKIITINASKLFDYYAKQNGKENVPFCLDTQNRYFYQQVVKQLDDFDECPLLHQIIKTKTFEESNPDIENTDDWLMDKMVILDCDRIFGGLGNDVNQMSDSRKSKQEKVRDLMENGFDIQFDKEKKVHMVPFDKSGNMSRNSRISFINDKYYKELNDRLNLGMDFSEIPVVLSKYYAYRGLYLSTSKRIEHKKIKLTPETIVILSEKRMKDTIKLAYENDVPYVTAQRENNTNNWSFTKSKVIDIKHVNTPFDGVGIISPEYTGYINESLKVEGANSFQVRMPFVKGMLHQVDFRSFLEEFDTQYDQKSEGPYWYKDAFGIQRDLKKAQILLTESMFKGMKWIKYFCEKNKVSDPEKYGDPMKFFCEAMEKYGHTLYISGTNLPYGHSRYTHLTYQMINTLDFTDKEFEAVTDKYTKFIDKPKDYIFGWDSEEAGIFDSAEIDQKIPAWKQVLKTYPEFEKDRYIASELENTKKGLITKIANGKIAVEGQTRFLCRDLMPLLLCLLPAKDKIQSNYYKEHICLFFRFFMPMTEKNNNLRCSGFTAFFRSPHLSRNEQCLLQPFVKRVDENDSYFNTQNMPTEEEYEQHVDLYQKYFGHLTGMVMVPRGSIVPLCLGGADFDGDLVNVVFDENVVEAVKRGCYENWLYRKLPVIEIPGSLSKEESVPKMVPYEHIKNTFSNAIGYLSNAAISIGQIEYARNEANEDKADRLPTDGQTADIPQTDGLTADIPKCWNCTILTGLEIDAAKNGEHPNLSNIREYKIPKANYLKFHDRYERFRQDPDFLFDRMEVTITQKTQTEKAEEQESIEKEYEIELRCPKTLVKCDIDAEEVGTWINRLPWLFEQEFKKYKNTEKKKSQKIANPFGDISKDTDYGNISAYQKKCQAVMEIYFSYRKLLRAIRKEKNKESYGRKNTIKLISKIYDRENDRHINEEVYSALRNKIEASLKGHSIDEIREKMNTEKWMFQPRDRRGKVLDQIMCCNLNASLNEDERELLFHFGQYGYKMLWHILAEIKDTQVKDYEDIKEDVFPEDSGIEVNQTAEKGLEGYIEQLEIIAQSYYDCNWIKAEQDSYYLCIHRLKRITERENLSTDQKVRAFYELTISDAEKGKIFWDVFTWEELSSSLDKKEK